MKVKDLIAELQKLDPDAEVEVNDNAGGEVYEIEQIDFFEFPGEPKCAVIQVNC